MLDETKTAQTTEEEVIITEPEEVVEDAGNDESDAEFSDSEQEVASEDKVDDGKPAEQDKPWKNGTNAEHARLRREAEKEAAVKKARTEAVIETLGGVNPFTGDKIEDEADVAEYLTMKEIEKAGKDPIADYSRFVKAKTKEQDKAKQEQSSREEWFQKDREDFETKHPGVDLTTVMGDEMFMAFSDGKLGKVPMAKIYSDYKAFETKAEEKAKQRAAQILANKSSSPGKLSNEDGGGDKYYTPEQVKSMTRDEVKKNYSTIIESMKKWN